MRKRSSFPTDGIPGIAAKEEMIRNAELRLDLTHKALFKDALLSLTGGPEAAFGQPAVAPGLCFLKADGTWLRPLRPPLDTVSDLRGALDVVRRDAPAGTLGVVGSSPELCVKVRGSSSMLRLGCLGDLLRFEKREIEVAAFAPDRSSPQSNRGDEAERTGSVGEGAGAPDPTLDLGVQALEAVRGA